MQFINTFKGVKTRCVCKPDQTLFSATTNKNGKKRSGHARLHLQQIADTLGLPTKGSAAVTRQLIEGKLMEMGKEPPNVQVVVQGTYG